MKKIIKTLLFPFYLIALILLSVFLYLLSLLPRFFSGRYYHYLSRLWCRIFLHVLRIDLSVVYKNEKTLPEHYVLVSNHPSFCEDFAIPAFFDIYPLAKAGVRDWIILGRISDYAGTIFVKRDSQDSRHAAMQSLVDGALSGKNMVIFPEGGCKGKRIYERFHTGAFDVALQANIPILPVFLHYVDQDTFEWTDKTLVEKIWQIFKNDNNVVNYYVHDAIPADNFSDKKEFANYTHAQYLEWQKQYLD